MSIKFSQDKINSIREAKKAGMTLTEISRNFNCAKSTVSVYCRDIFLAPNRKYATENDMRKGITTNKRKNPNTNHKCIDCDKQIKRENVRCLSCYLKNIRAQSKEHISKSKISHTKSSKSERIMIEKIPFSLIRKPFSKKIEKSQNIEICSLSPTQRHYWLLNIDNSGECKYCHEPAKIPDKESYNRLF